jgi:signal transduction histidine kinase
VQDNGTGIDPRQPERIFKIFETLDASNEWADIDLVIVTRIIEVHGEKIWAGSEGEGKGSTVLFTLPNA